MNLWPRMTYSETEPVNKNDSFRQGDIVQIFQQMDDGFPSYGVVINADCDLLHCKIDGVLSILPIMRFSEFFKEFWAPAYIEERKSDLVRSICRDSELDEERRAEVIEWLREDGADLVSTKLAAISGGKAKSFLPKLKQVGVLISSEVGGPVEQLLQLCALSGKSPSSEFEKYAKAALKALGDGHFLLNEICGLSELAFVIRLRRVFGISTAHVFSDYATFAARGARARVAAVRVARLTDLYRFKVAQVFAHQFSKIGLPDEIIALHSIATDAAVKTVIGNVQ